MIPVTKTFLPPQEEYNRFLKRIWESNQIANGGDLHFELISKLREYLEVDNVILTANGTLPLQLALKSVAKKGEVITTPFSYVATVSAIVWENCKPVFVDIHPDYLTIDETKIEAAITENTTAILATHVFGNPCNVEKIQEIAEKYNLRVIYDAAHGFGVKYKGKSIFDYGDISTCSFHATKLFHTGEGGAIFCKEKKLNDQLFYRHNFGHDGPVKFHGLGINAKMSELQAGMGLAVLPYVTGSIKKRKKLVEEYNELLDLDNIGTIKIRKGVEWNYSYYPIIFESEDSLMNIKLKLENQGIFPRRYFYPSLNKLSYVDNVKLEISESIASRILCLPLYHSLPINKLYKIIRIVNEAIKLN